MKRRDFLKTSALAAAAGPFVARQATAAQAPEMFQISLAEWSLNGMLFAGTLDHLDFPKVAREAGIDAVEYVNQFFMDKATDAAYLAEMKRRADGEGVRSVLIMCDSEGMLGHPEEAERIQTVENHKKWVTAAKTLGCHAIRVNGYSQGGPEEAQRLVADGLHRLCEYADGYDIGVIIENHGGYSSNGAWLAGTIQKADHPRAGTLPDFGNFRIDAETSYDSYQGVDELMPFAQGVSVKPRVWDHEGGEHDLDYVRMMKVVLNHGYHGYCGIEHGRRGTAIQDIQLVRRELIRARDMLRAGTDGGEG